MPIIREDDVPVENFDTGRTYPVIEYIYAGPHDALASCLAFDVATLATMPVAFEGTVRSAEGEQVTLDVDARFTGSESGRVQVTAPAGRDALIGWDRVLGW